MSWCVAGYLLIFSKDENNRGIQGLPKNSTMFAIHVCNIADSYLNKADSRDFHDPCLKKANSWDSNFMTNVHS